MVQLATSEARAGVASETPVGRVLLFTTEDTLLGSLCSRIWDCRTYNRTELQAECEHTGLPWSRQLWFSPVHRVMKMGGILVETFKAETAVAVS